MLDFTPVGLVIPDWQIFIKHGFISPIKIQIDHKIGMTGNMEKRVYNFSPGPAMLPLSVLEESQKNVVSIPGLGQSMLEISHRSKTFTEVIEQAEANLRTLLKIPDGYRVLFLQGGAQLQFAMIPMTFLRSGKSADYILSGTWSKKASKEAKTLGNVNVVWNGESSNYDHVPSQDELKLDSNAAYVYHTSNETIQGVQFQTEPEVGDVPLVCDASSDLLCRPLSVEKYGILYACAQKNIGPAGVTLVIIRDDLVKQTPSDLPSLLNYSVLAEGKSLVNTPPVFSIYVMKLVTDWLLNDIGGLDRMLEINQKKADLLYDVIDASNGFYDAHAKQGSRSLMNVAFRLPNEQLQDGFLTEAAKQDLVALKGHRSVGGCRASIYNAMPVEGVQKLAKFMYQFASVNAQ